MHQRDVVGHVVHHVQQRVLLHLDPTVTDQHELVLRRLVRRLHVVDLRIHAHVAPADEQPRVHLRVLLHQLPHQHQHRVRVVLHAEQQLVTRVLHREERLQVAEQIRIDAHQRLYDRHAGQRRLVRWHLADFTVQLPVTGDQRQRVNDPHYRPEYHEKYRESVQGVYHGVHLRTRILDNSEA